jgi:hypothetical protein
MKAIIIRSKGRALAGPLGKTPMNSCYHRDTIRHSSILLR